MNLLCLCPQPGRDSSIDHRRDFTDELSLHARVFFYGPDREGFSPQRPMREIMTLARSALGRDPDWVLLGHDWLDHREGAPADRFPRIVPSDAGLPVAAILDREHLNLSRKLEYLKHAGIDVGFSHHHESQVLSTRTGVRFHFWPHAVNHRVFHPPKGAKSIDVGFAGTLIAPGPGRPVDVRAALMREMFRCVGDLPVRRRGAYRDLTLAFSVPPRSALGKAANTLLRIYRPLDQSAYAALVRSCRVMIAPRSPADEISTRLFECMASGTLVLAEANPAHRLVFPESSMLEFTTLADFRRQLREALSSVDREAMTRRAYEHVLAKHTWEVRVRSMLDILRAAQSSGLRASDHAA